MNIRLSRLHFPVTTLGPGKRIGIWFQGCSIQCPGCISADTWSTSANMTTLESLLSHITPWLPVAEGITISGGEPFDQPTALIALLNSLRSRVKLDILVYSGHAFENIAAIVEECAGLLDALITDPFEIETPHSKPLRGSDNQRLHLLTTLGQEKFKQYERQIDETDKSLDVMFDHDGSVWFAGIPKRDDFFQLQQLLRDQGHQVQISADKTRSANSDN